MITLEDIFNNIEKNPYCPNCNKRLNTNVNVEFLIKYPHLNKETIKYFNNLIFA